MKHVFKIIVKLYLLGKILNYKDKMNFFTLLNLWLAGDFSDFIKDIFSTSKAHIRELINNNLVLKGLPIEVDYSLKIWGLLYLEISQ